MNFKELFHTVFIFWVVMDSVGNVPIVLSMLRPFSHKRQQQIIIRELIFSLIAMIFFLFFGIGFFNLLHVQSAALQFSGGIILFLISLRMIFPKPLKEGALHKEPYVVPIAVPAIAGPGILATISLYGGSGLSKPTLLLAIFLAWLASVPVLLMASLLKKWLGDNGIIAIERLFGYLIILLATQMWQHALLSFFASS